MKRAKPSRTVLLVVLIAALAALLVGVVAARYVSERGETLNLVTAKQFYFTSDLLTPDGAEYTLNAGSTSTSFELRNYADVLRWAEDDIAYTVTVSGGASVSPASGTIANSGANAAAITISGLTNGNTYTVTATGSAGYVQTISASFTVQNAESAVYKHLDSSDPNCVVLTVWTRGVQGTASIGYPDGLIPDDTDPVMETWETGAHSVTDALSFGEDAYASHQYRFFISGGSFTADSFSVSVGGVEAIGSTP